MVRKTHSRKADDALLEPIVMSNRLSGLTKEEERWYVFRSKVAKLFCIAEQYGISIGDTNPHGWALLALRLAEELGHPGFRVVESYRDIPRGRGRPRNSGTIDRFLVHREIDKMLSEKTKPGAAKMTVSQACKLLCTPKGHTTKAFKNSRAESLETAYYKASRELKEMYEGLRHRRPPHPV